MKDWQFHIEAKAGDTLEITVYDVIGESFWEDGVTAKDVLKALRSAPNAKTINLRINSVGGVVDDAKAMVNLLDERKRAGATVVAYVDGLAASAAAYLTTVADRVVMPSNAFMMIHEVRGGVRGTASELVAHAELMSRYNQQLVEAFAATSARRGVAKSAQDYLDAFAKGDTYLDASEAIAWGLADEETDALDVAACLVDVSTLDGLPEALRRAPYVASTEPSGRVGDLVAVRIASGVDATVPRNQPPAPTPQGNHAPAASGGASPTPSRRKIMNENELRAQHPELYAAVLAKGKAEGLEAGRAEGVASERDRVAAHLELGETSGDVSIAIAAIKDGAEMTQTMTAKYLAAGMKRNAIAATQADSDAAGAVVAGANSQEDADTGDEVLARLLAKKGAK